MTRVDAFDIECGVGFGVALGLRGLQHFGERQALAAHLGQDEVGGAVDDAGDPFNAVSHQAFAQSLNNRDTTGDRSFEGDDDAFGACSREDFVAVQREQRFVCGDDVLAVGNRFEHQLLRNCVAANQFDDDVNVGIFHERERVVGDDRAARHYFFRKRRSLFRHVRNRDRTPGTT